MTPHDTERDVAATVERTLRARVADHEAQIRDLLEEREELLTEIRRLRMGNHPALRAWLADRILGPRCDVCRERFRGWRTLLAHHHLDHAGDRL